MSIPFNRPYVTGRELEYLRQALEGRHLSGNGEFTKECESYLEKTTGTRKALLVHSCTAALEMAALLCELKPGDEVIVPSFTFVTTASSIALRGAVPVFVDIRPDTLNIDEKKIEAAITAKTKAISVVHYAGVAAEMDAIMAIAKKHGLRVIEDAAQCVGSSYKGRALGTIGDLGAVSFHETKNVISGEGGALYVNNESLVLPAEIIREKGTNRTSFMRREVAFYTWVELGSSYVMSEMLAAFLLAQLENMETITAQRLKIWNHYYESFAEAERAGLVQRPVVPEGCKHNGHLFYLLLPNVEKREALIGALKKEGIGSTFHYLPLHLSPAGKKYGRAHGDLRETIAASERLVRLPVWPELDQVERVVAAVKGHLA
ncbi:MAG TPA: dTDP-4-amino-4,6-dideoxygalactose transaminase [Bdellovibrionales bacterium]|nr:dTDP-4-amino-4,6-dideoxygalactose transaminase [Bdellovibrionales bacterium]